MENISKLSLEYKKGGKTLTDHKRQLKTHTINKEALQKDYVAYLPLLAEKLSATNVEWDSMGFEDLKFYEKWLSDVHE